MEKRRSTRINTQLLTQIVGVDTAWTQRRTNISMSGIFLQLTQDVGEPGSVQRLLLASLDEQHRLDVMARVVRVLTAADTRGGVSIMGVAFEFLPVNDQHRRNMMVLLSHIMGPRNALFTEPVPTSDEEHNQGQGVATVRIDALSVDNMVLSSSWAAQVGEAVRCHMRLPGTPQMVQLEGKVVRAQPLARDPRGALGQMPRYLITVALEPTAGQGETWAVGEAIDTLVEPPPDTHEADGGTNAPPEHLKGMLSRIRLPSILVFAEMERMTGVLSVHAPHGEAHIYLQSGRIVDCTSPSGSEPLAILRDLLPLDSGSFEFLVAEVDRPDKVALSTTHVLLKLTHEAEEAGQGNP